MGKILELFMQLLTELWQNLRPIGEHLKPFAEATAYLAGAAFLVHRLHSGGVALRVTCVRHPSERPGIDYLVVTIGVRKGADSTVQFVDAQVRISARPNSLIQDQQRFVGIAPLSYQKLKDETDVVKESPFLNLSPGDETQFVALCEAGSHYPYLVEVVVLGKRWRTKKVQWRISEISFPAEGM